MSVVTYHASCLPQVDPIIVSIREDCFRSLEWAPVSELVGLFSEEETLSKIKESDIFLVLFDPINPFCCCYQLSW